MDIETYSHKSAQCDMLYEAICEILKMARDQYAADQNNAAWVEVIKIAQKALAEIR